MEIIGVSRVRVFIRQNRSTPSILVRIFSERGSHIETGFVNITRLLLVSWAVVWLDSTYKHMFEDKV